MKFYEELDRNTKNIELNLKALQKQLGPKLERFNPKEIEQQEGVEKAVARAYQQARMQNPPRPRDTLRQGQHRV